MPYRIRALEAGGTAADVISALAVLAWAIPMLFFEPFRNGPTFYAPFESIASQHVWGWAAALSGGLTILGMARYLKTGIYWWRARFITGLCRSAVLGAIAAVAWSSNPQVPTPYVQTVLALVAVFGASVSYILRGDRKW